MSLFLSEFKSIWHVWFLSFSKGAAQKMKEDVGWKGAARKMKWGCEVKGSGSKNERGCGVKGSGYKNGRGRVRWKGAARKMKEGVRWNGGVKDCKFLFILKGRTLNDLKVASSRANNDEHLSSQVLKSKPKMYMFRATKKV